MFEASILVAVGGGHRHRQMEGGGSACEVTLKRLRGARLSGNAAKRCCLLVLQRHFLVVALACSLTFQIVAAGCPVAMEIL
jgi:hypothetical protein